MKEINLEQMIDTYLLSKENTWSKTTMRSARYKFATILNLSPQNPAELHAKLLRADYAPYTIKQYLVLMAGVDINYATYLKQNSHTFRNAYKEKTSRVDRASFYSALAQAKDLPQLFNLLIVLGYAGLRISEALSLKEESIDRTKDLLYIIGKGDKPRVVPFNTQMFVGKYNPPTLSFVRKNWPTALADFTPHDLRAFFITELVNEPGLSIKDAALVAGHSNINTTARYIRPDFDKITKAVRRIANEVA